MGKQPETIFKEKVHKRLRATPETWFFKNVAVIRGIPDEVICHRGLAVFLELKIPPNTLTAGQRHNIMMINRAGGFAREVTPQNFESVYQEMLAWPETFYSRGLSPPPSSKSVAEQLGYTKRALTMARKSANTK